jgi:long-chain acyl-CoA synthetase
MQSSVVGVIVPDKEVFADWVAKHHAGESKPYESEVVLKDILKNLNAYGKLNDLKGFEQIRAIYLTPEEFSIDNDLLTPTFKLKREIAKKVYESQIESMYATINNGRAFN